MEAEQHTDDRQIFQRTFGHGGVCVAQHQPHGEGLAEVNDHPRKRAVDQLHQRTVADALLDAVIAACAVVLAHIGRHGHADALHRQGEHLADLLARRLGRHDDAAHQIDGVLHDDRTDGRDRILKPHGQADDRQPPGVGCGKMQVVPGKMHVLDLCKEPPGTQQAAEQLACHGSDGRTIDAHAAGHNKRPVQHNV